jgi:hypothetical protein
MSRATSATNDGGIAAELRNWARGCHSTEAAVEFRHGLRMVVSSDQEVAIGLGVLSPTNPTDPQQTMWLTRPRSADRLRDDPPRRSDSDRTLACLIRTRVRFSEKGATPRSSDPPWPPMSGSATCRE